MNSFCDLKQQRSIINTIKRAFISESSLEAEEMKEYILDRIKSRVNLDLKFEQLWTNKEIDEVLKTYNMGAPEGFGAPNYIRIKNSSTTYYSSLSIGQLFHGSNVASGIFQGFVNESIVNSFLLGKPGEPYVNSDSALVESLNTLKNDLFGNIQTFLSSVGKISQSGIIKLYDAEGNFNTDQASYYKQVMLKAQEYFDESYETFTFQGKTIPNLDGSKNEAGNKAYRDVIFLANFDTLIEQEYGSLIEVNQLYFNDLNNPLTHDKYRRRIEPESTLYWNNEAHSDEGVESYEMKLPATIVSSIPLYDVNNKKMTGYLEMGDMYLLASVINSFEQKHAIKMLNLKDSPDNALVGDEVDYSNYNLLSENVNEGLQWYITNALNVIEKNDRNHLMWGTFRRYRNILHTLNNYINNEELGIPAKEADTTNPMSIITILGQVLNNSYGASYTIFEEGKGIVIQELYSQDFNNTGLNGTLMMTMSANSENKNFYNITSTVEKNKLKKLFTPRNGTSKSEGVSLATPIKNAITNKEFVSDLRKYIYEKTGLSLNNNAIAAMVTDILTYSPDFTVRDLQGAFQNMLYSMNEDFRSDALRETLADHIGYVADATVGSLVTKTINTPLYKAISAGYLEHYPVKAISNIKTLTGETIPAYKIANLSYRDPSLLAQQRELQKRKPERFYKSLLLEETPAIIGTNTRLEIIHEDKNKAAAMFTPAESYHTSLKMEFFDNILKDNKFDVIIGAYSDKSTVITKTIDGEAKIRISGNKTVNVLDLSIKELLDVVRDQGGAYYQDAVTDVIVEYKNLFESTPEELRSEPMSTAIRKITEAQEKLKNGYVDLTDVIKVINAAIEPGIPNLLTNAPGFSGLISEELHYSSYNVPSKTKKGGQDRVTSLNRLLFDNYKIFNTPKIFNEFVKVQEKQFITNYSTIDSALNSGVEPNKFKFSTSEINAYLESTGLGKTNLGKFGPDKEGNPSTDIFIGDEVHPLIQKWMWTNALFRNEYLFVSTKGEYMHPHKKGLALQEGVDITQRWDEYMKDSSARLDNMSKRNVTNTSTIKLPVKNTKYGEPINVRIASIEDYKADLYGITGKHNKGQDAHDGSSFIHPVYSRQIDASYPGEGYKGTKKRFGTLILDSAVIVKKDAESEISNSQMLFSTISEIDFAKLNEKMLSIPFGELQLDLDMEFTDTYYYHANGFINNIQSVKLKHDGTNNVLEMKVIPSKDGMFLGPRTISFPVNTLHDIYQAIGGMYSSDSEGELSEGSMDLLYEIVSETVDSEGNEGVLKDKMIHIISNHSSLKAGATNLNSRDRWKDGGTLSSFTVSSNLMGPQLDASHNADGSTIKEVTQIISAMAQGGLTYDIAREAYQDIQNIIKDAAFKYDKYLKESLDGKGQNLYKFLTNKFIDAVKNSKGNDVAKYLIDELNKSKTHIPFSNQNFYNAFVQDLITRMNTDFISRKYSGMGAPIVPSHGIVQLLELEEDGEIITVSQKDMTQRFLSGRAADLKDTRTNEEYIKQLFEETFQPKEISAQEIEIGDTIIISEQVSETGEIISPARLETINSLTDYYSLKDTVGKGTVIKSTITPRDLKPTLHTFTTKFTDNKMNVFDLQGVRLDYMLGQFLDKKTISEDDFNTLTNLYNFAQTEEYKRLLRDGKVEEGSLVLLDINDLTKKDPLVSFMKRYLAKWRQRDLSLLEHGFITNKIVNFEAHNENDDFLRDTIEDVLEHYSKHGLPIYDLKFTRAELITSDIYKTTFGRDTKDSLYKIKKQGYTYFQNKLKEQFTKDKVDADIRLDIEGLENSVYIKYVQELPSISQNNQVDLFENAKDSDPEKKPRISRYNHKGEVVYDIPNTKEFVVENTNAGKEIIYIKIKDNSLSDIEKKVNRIISSTRGKIKHVDPLMRYYDRVEYEHEVAGKVITGYNLNHATINVFNKFSGNTRRIPDVRHGLFVDNTIEKVTEAIAKRKYSSWEKSHEIIASRIPAQSMQSFMPMRIMGYTDSTRNDAFVSLHQIWLQGSDFDIDKAYLLGYSFDNDGIYEPWTNMSTYSSLEQIEALEKLPMPSSMTIQEVFYDEDGNIFRDEGEEGEKPLSPKTKIKDISEDMYNIITSLTRDGKIPKSIGYEMDVNTINLFNTLIRGVAGYKYVSFDLDSLVDNFPDLADDIDSLAGSILYKVNIHNKTKPKQSSYKNGVVSKLSRVISSPANQLLANSPISLQEVHDAVAANRESQAIARIKKGEEAIPEVLNSPYDIISYGKLQYNAAIGKDDVGIFANGVKVFYGLTDYYNNLFRKATPESLSDISKSGAFFDVTFNFTDAFGNTKTYRRNTIADLQLSRSVRKVLDAGRVSENYGIESHQSDAALILSALLSAATDNAKELLMAKVNATPDLAAMHTYLTILGLEINDIVEIMTSEVVDDVIKLKENNLYQNKYGMSMDKIVAALEESYIGNEALLGNLATFHRLYKASKELTALSGMFGINQKRKANTWELYKFLTRYETVFSDSNQPFRSLSDDADQLLLAIKNHRPDLLITNENGEDITNSYIARIIDKVSALEVDKQNYDKSREKAVVNIIKEGIDFRYYTDPRNKEYRQAVKEYYGLIRQTFNVFEIVDTIPHFKEMINSLTLSHDILNESSIKYNFVTNTLKDVINIANLSVKGFNKKYIDTGVINKGIQFLDGKVREDWLKNNTPNIEFSLDNIQTLMKAADIDSFKMYTDNSAASNKTYNMTNSMLLKQSGEFKMENIKLDSAYNIANFKNLMEQVLLPYLKHLTKGIEGDVFSNSLKVETAMTPFGVRGSAIVSTFPLQQLNNPVSAQRFHDLVNKFDTLDISKLTKGKVINFDGKTVNWRDLFYVYNLIVNNERYGNKRLTPLMENYAKEEGLAQSYINYWSQIEKGEINIFPNAKNEDFKDSLETNLMIHIASNKGSISIKRGDGPEMKYSITNPDFVLISEFYENKKVASHNKDMYDIMRLIKSKGILVELKCK